MNVLIVTLGSHGDVHPFCGLGVALAGRGHRVTVLANEYFYGLIQNAGLTAGPPVGSADDFRTVMERPDLWHPFGGTRLVLKLVTEALGRVYEPVLEYVRRNPDCVVIASSLGMAARCAQEKLRFPMATVHLAPSVMRSVYAPAKMPGLNLPQGAPHWLRRGVWSLADRFILDPMIAPVLNKFRAQIGLPPIRRVLKDWWHSPDRVIGLWPDWFAPTQPDWPPQTILCGFPLWDERGLEPIPGDVQRFLDSGDPPIAFTPGSAMLHGQSFFAAAAEACRLLGRRGILLTRHAEQVPQTLPDGVIHAPFVPLSELLPRCAAIVHHGGIGTMSQALRTGVPQLVMAMNHDQPDNANRATRLGVAETIARNRFNAHNAAAALGRLVGNRDVRARCDSVALRFRGIDAPEMAALAIERLGITPR